MMGRFNFYRRSWVRVLLCLALCAGAAGATTLERMSIERMSQIAPLIVRVRCLGNSTAWDSGEIWTFTSFESEETWRGSVSLQRLTVRLLGGRVGNLTSSISGIPRFRVGEEVILFLEPTGRGNYSIVSWQQGTFRIRREPRAMSETVMQDTASFDVFDPSTRHFEAAGIRNVSLDTFRSRVAAAILSQSGSQQ